MIVMNRNAQEDSTTKVKEWRAQLAAILNMDTSGAGRENRLRALSALFCEARGCEAVRDQTAAAMKKEIRDLLEHGQNKTVWEHIPEKIREAVKKRVLDKHEEYGRGLSGREVELMVSMRVWRLLPRRYQVIGISYHTIRLWEDQAGSGGLDAALLSALPKAFLENLDDGFFTDIIANTEYKDVCRAAFSAWKSRYEDVPGYAVAHFVKIAASAVSADVCRTAWRRLCDCGAQLSKQDYLDIFIHSRAEDMANEASVMLVRLYGDDLDRHDYMQIFLLHGDDEIRKLAADTMFALYALDQDVPDEFFGDIARRTEDMDIAAQAERIVGQRRMHRLHLNTMSHEKMLREKLRLEKQWKTAMVRLDKSAGVEPAEEAATWDQAVAWERAVQVSRSVWYSLPVDYREDKKRGMQMDYLMEFILRLRDRDVCDDALHLLQKKFRWELEVEEQGKDVYLKIALFSVSDWVALEAGHMLLHAHDDELEEDDLRALLNHHHPEIRREAADMLHRVKTAS